MKHGFSFRNSFIYAHLVLCSLSAEPHSESPVREPGSSRGSDRVSSAELNSVPPGALAATGPLQGTNGSCPIGGSFAGDRRFHADFSDGRRRVFSVPDLREGEGAPGPRRMVEAHAFSPDGTYTLRRSENVVTVAHADSGETVGSFSLPHGTVYASAFTSDSRQVIVAGSSGQAEIYDLASGKKVQTLGGFTENDFILDLQISGNVVAATTMAGLVVVDLRTGRPRFPRIPGQPQPGTVSLSPDGNRVAFHDQNDGVFVYDTQNGNRVARLPSDIYGVQNLVISPDGRTVATSSGGEISLFDVPSAQLRETFERPAMISGLHFSPDGALLVSSEFRAEPFSCRLVAWDTDPRRFAGRTLGEIWQLLGSHARDAQGAARELREHPEWIAEIARRVAQEAPASPARAYGADVGRWLRELTDDSYAVRARAHHELQSLGTRLVRDGNRAAARWLLNHLQRQRENPLDLEQQRRIDLLLQSGAEGFVALARSGLSPQGNTLRNLRAIEAIGAIASGSLRREALQQVLERWPEGSFEHEAASRLLRGESSP